jgi:hypothetical protein
MSVLRPLLSRRGRLVFVAVALLLVGALVAAPSVSGAKAAVKQFIATIHPTTGISGVPDTWTVQVTNCGFPVVSPCTASSTIGLGSIRINVPTEFRNAVTVSISDHPNGKNWTVSSYNSATGVATAVAVTGSDKLGPGESVSIAINATPTTTACPPTPFTTAAWGSASVPGTDPFQIKTPQPTVTVAAPSGDGCLASGGTVTGPGGQTETITGNFQGHVIVIFGGDTGPDCSSEAGFGDLGDQWEQYHLPNQVTITPASDFVAGSEDKISTSEFLLPAGGGDSSWFLICYAVPQAGHTAFETRGGGVARDDQTIGGIPQFVGILASCADAPTPCVSEQFLTTGQPNPAPPWTPSLNKVHIAVRMAPGDPYKR